MKTNVKTVVSLTIAILFAAQTDLSAQRGRGAVIDGNKLFEEGRFEEARERYLDALRENPESPLIRFNEGNALYQSSQFQQALESYQQALAAQDPALQSKAWYNLGNTLYRQQMLQESAQAYRQALKADPTDPDAKHNLEWVLRQMEEQEQNNESDQNQDPQQDQQQDQQDQQQQQDDPQEQEQGQDQQQDQNQDQQEDQQQQPEQENQPGEQQQGEPPPMSREEAERLLDAITEDPNEIRRQPPVRARGVKPKKPW